jgi:hypothetical protein
MVRSHFFIAGLLATTLGLALVGCGSDDAAESTSSGGDPVDQTGAQPVEPGPAGVPGDGPGVVLAVKKLYLGDTSRTGSPDPANGWKDFGFNLDKLVSTKTSTNLCKPRAGGSPSSIYPDGNQGIDNSFGKNILPIILGLAPDASEQLNSSIAEGSFTIMMNIEALGAAADYNPLTTKLYAGANLGAAPKFDGTDMWPVVPELLSDPTDIGSSKIAFTQSYVRNNTWVSGSAAPLTLSLAIAGFTLDLTIDNAIIAMDLGADHKSATNGTIAGIINTEGFIEELRKVAGAFDEGLCTGSTFDSLANQLRQASDIMRDGSQNPGAECDGISIGLGFDAAEVQLGAIAEAAEPAPSPCDSTGG